MKKLFGTDGIRGIANTEITPSIAFKLAKAAAKTLCESNKKIEVLIGKDTRISGDMLESALVSGFLSEGADVRILGVIPTPALPIIMKEKNSELGIMISASHNPAEFNGIKLFNSKGYKLSDEKEKKIEALIFDDKGQFGKLSALEMGRKIDDYQAIEIYKDKIIKSKIEDISKLKIAVDCANGSNYKIAKEVFDSLSLNARYIGVSPNGLNINENCGSTSLDRLKELVVKESLDLGIAFDGDGDRVLAVDERGELIDGDKIMLAFAKAMKTDKTLGKNYLVGTIMSNMGLERALQDENIELIKTKVGDRYVLEEMLRSSYEIGGEQSGHIILLKYNTTGDGLLCGLKLLEVISRYYKKASDLIEQVQEFPQILRNVTVRNEVKNTIHEHPEIIKKSKEVERILSGRGRIVLRASGTEPIFRVMLEGENKEEITRFAQEFEDLIHEIV